MKYNLLKLINHNNILILFLVVLVISVGVISNNVTNIRDPRPQAATNTMTFEITNDLDDGFVSRYETYYPPPYKYVDTENAMNFAVRTYTITTSQLHVISNTLVRWNTSALPNDATITSAILRIKVNQKYNDNSRNFVADWYTSWPIDPADSTTSGGSGTAFSVPISTVANPGSDDDFTLSNPASNISKTGYTGLRFYISGGQATGLNEVNFRDYNSGGQLSPEFAPKLIVTYTTPDPVPTASISADDTSISYNTSTTIRWSSSNASSCSASGAWSGSKATSGAQSTGNLTSSRTYRISCTGAGGTSPTKSVTVNVGSKPPTPDPDPDPDSVLPPSSGEGTPQPPPPGGGLPTLPPAPPGIPGVEAPIDPDIVNILKIKLSVPFLLGNIKTPLIVGGFVQDIELQPGKTDYEVDVRGAKFTLGKTLNIQIGGNKTLIKKLKLKTKAPKQPVNFGALYLGDMDRNNKIDQKDIESYIEDIVNQDESSDVNADGVVNSLDWAIILVNFGKRGGN